MIPLRAPGTAQLTIVDAPILELLNDGDFHPATSAIAGCVPPADAENYIQQGLRSVIPATVTDSIWWCGGKTGPGSASAV